MAAATQKRCWGSGDPPQSLGRLSQTAFPTLAYATSGTGARRVWAWGRFPLGKSQRIMPGKCYTNWQCPRGQKCCPGAELLTEPELVGKIQMKKISWESRKSGQKPTALRCSCNFCTAECQAGESVCSLRDLPSICPVQ
uniref:WAP domain-containing protein n=1 Tax=Strix occidentalis caurina TaxID=311401 RepID=A0A8D0EPN4_STROC